MRLHGLGGSELRQPRSPGSLWFLTTNSAMPHAAHLSDGDQLSRGPSRWQDPKSCSARCSGLELAGPQSSGPQSTGDTPGGAAPQTQRLLLCPHKVPQGSCGASAASDGA